MSFYGNPFNPFNNNNRRQHPFAGPPAYSYGYPASNPFNPFMAPPTAPAPSAPPAPPAPVDLDEEERIALAHLASIQQRRGQSAAREAEPARQRAEAEREEALIRAAISRELAQRQRELTIARAQREREIALATAEQERAVAQRQRAIVLVNSERARQLATAQAERQREIAVAQANQRRIALATAYEQRRQQYLAGRQAHHDERVRRQAARRAERSEGHGRHDLEGLNGLLGALFGVNIAQSSFEEKKEEQAPEGNPPAAGSTEPVPAPARAPVAPAAEAPTAPPATEEKKEGAFPEELNQILSQFLGLRIEPTDSTETNTSPGSKKVNEVPKGLNEFLSRFGLDFEPLVEEFVKDKVDSAVAVASSSQPAVNPTEKQVEQPTTTSVPEPANNKEAPRPQATTGAEASKPLTAFLNELTDIPPFVRDILSSVEAAFAEGAKQHQDSRNSDKKGKGVAEGEKKDRSTSAPAPAPAADSAPAPEAPTPAESDQSTSSLDTLNSISADLSALQSAFTFPSRLAFSNAPTEDVSPRLLFNRVNSPYHSQAHKLLQLLLQADSVSSGGDKEVRKRRKDVVRDVEGAIEELEKMRDGLWLEVRERREKGEIESEEEDHHSSGSSVVDVDEYHTASTVESATVPEPVEERESATELSVPASDVAENIETPEVEQSVEEKAQAVEEGTALEHSVAVEAEKQEEKEEGYELI